MRLCCHFLTLARNEVSWMFDTYAFFCVLYFELARGCADAQA